MSQTLFEIRRVFQQNRPEISKVNQGQFSMANAVRELGHDQLIDNLNHMFAKEAGLGGRGSQQLQHNPVDFLQENFGGKITPAMREEAVLSILQFSVQTNCLDQTILQAAQLADNYLRHNQSCQPAFMRIIYAIALEVSIKLNEQMILSIEDICTLFENRFSMKMLVNLERHILTLNNFRVNVATPLDFVLNFVYLESDLLSQGALHLHPEELVNETLPLLHHAMSQYDLSRKKKSSLGMAALCHALQELHEEMQAENSQNGPNFEEAQVSPMQQLRDRFLDAAKARFPQLDLDEIYEILSAFKLPYVELARQNGQLEDQPVSAPWPFDRLAVNNQSDAEMSLETEAMRRSDALVAGVNMCIPQLKRLSLEEKVGQGSGRIRGGPEQTETDEAMVFSTADTSVQGTGRDPRHNLHMASQSSMGGLEESKSTGRGDLSRRKHHITPQEYPPPELGRASLSESTGPPSKAFSPQFDRMSSQTKHNQRRGEEEDLLDEGRPGCSAFNDDPSSSSAGRRQEGQPSEPRSVDGVFTLHEDVDPGPDESSSEDELTYNSQGKPVRKRGPAAADKKQSRKQISKQPHKPPAKGAPGDKKQPNKKPPLI